MIRVIQVIMIRLQRVLFTALRNYLGLNAELVQNHMRSKGSVMQGAGGTGITGINMGTTTASITTPGTIVSQSSQTIRSVASARTTAVSPVLRALREEHTLSDPDPNPNANALLFAEVHGDAPYIDLYHHQQQQNQSQSVPGAGGTSMGTTTRRDSLTFAGETIYVPSNASATPTSIDQRLVHSSAVDSLRRELGLSEEDAHIIEPFVEVRELEANVTLILEGNADDVCVWFVMTGSLAVYQSNADATRGSIKQDNRNDMLIHFVHPGEIVGGLAMLTGEASAYTIRARSSSRVAYIRRAAIYQ